MNRLMKMYLQIERFCFIKHTDLESIKDIFNLFGKLSFIAGCFKTRNFPITGIKTQEQNFLPDRILHRQEMYPTIWSNVEFSKLDVQLFSDFRINSIPMIQNLCFVFNHPVYVAGNPFNF